MLYNTYIPLVMRETTEEIEKMKPIVDISYWQQKIDYDKFAAAISGAILRGAYGIWKDTMFEQHYTELYKRGVPIGCYHYIIGNYTGLAQADIFNRVIKGKDLKLGLWNDVEDRSPTTGLFPAIVNEYHGNIELLARRKVGIYTGVYAWYEIMGADSKKYSDRPLWLAHYGVTAPSLPRYSGWLSWVLWQWGSKGRIDGYPSDIDMDVFNGSEEEYQKFFQLGSIVPEPPPIVIPPPATGVILPKLKVISEVRIRTSTSTSSLDNFIRMRKVGEIVNVEEIHVKNGKSVWVRDNIGWSAVVHYGEKYME